MFDHVSLGTNNIERSVHFYDAVMATLNHKRYFGDINDGVMAYGVENSFLLFVSL